jgi:ATP synthase F1 delta subunit
MSDTEFQVESLGAIYAQALINEAQKQGALDQVADDVHGIGQLLRENESFLAFTRALTIGEDERLATLQKIFGGRIHPLTLNVLVAMSRRDRLIFLRGLVEAFDDILKKMSGHVDVEVTSSQALDPGVLARLQRAISKSQAKTADIALTINPALIGGITVRIGDLLLDGSVATQLKMIREQLTRGDNLKAETVIR